MDPHLRRHGHLPKCNGYNAILQRFPENNENRGKCRRYVFEPKSACKYYFWYIRC